MFQSEFLGKLCRCVPLKNDNSFVLIISEIDINKKERPLNSIFFLKLVLLILIILFYVFLML